MSATVCCCSICGNRHLDGKAKESRADLTAQRDAALEALRPLARLGLAYQEYGEEVASLVLEFAHRPPRVGRVVLSVSDCLSALKTWKEYRGEEMP